jgi:hypothetical protein
MRNSAWGSEINRVAFTAIPDLQVTPTPVRTAYALPRRKLSRASEKILLLKRYCISVNMTVMTRSLCPFPGSHCQAEDLAAGIQTSPVPIETLTNWHQHRTPWHFSVQLLQQLEQRSFLLYRACDSDQKVFELLLGVVIPPLLLQAAQRGVAGNVDCVCCPFCRRNLSRLNRLVEIRNKEKLLSKYNGSVSQHYMTSPLLPGCRPQPWLRMSQACG